MEYTCSLARIARAKDGYVLYWWKSPIFPSCRRSSAGQRLSCGTPILFYRTQHLQSSSIWILLTRHIKMMSEEFASESTKNDIFLTLHVHKGGKRIYAPAQPYIKGIYSSDPHILTRIDVSAEDTREANEVSLEHPQGKPIEYTLVLSQNDKKRDVNYTLSVYSTSLPFACRLLPSLPFNQVS